MAQNFRGLVNFSFHGIKGYYYYCAREFKIFHVQNIRGFTSNPENCENFVP
jgi:hypothetical protein